MKKNKSLKCLLALLPLVFILSYLQAQTNNYISVKDHRFFDGEASLYYIGTNYWYGGLLGLEKDKERGISRLRTELDFLKSKGVCNLRVLAGPEGTGLVAGVDRVKPPFQVTKGIFDDNFLKGLDILLSEMGKRDMKAVIFLSNNWEWSGGFLQYLRWNDKISEQAFRGKLNWDETRDYVSKFYSCEACKADYLAQVNYIIGHTNSINKKKYSEDPTIMAWEIANEPRPMRPAAIDSYKQWIMNTSAFIKSKDENHLVTIGTEGYIGTENIAVYESIHADKNIDYLTIHIWPKNWEWFKGKDIAGGTDSINYKTTEYISRHIEIANKLNKPLVIEEFGLPRDGHSFDLSSSTSLRDKYYELIFKLLQNSAATKNVLGGANFWSYGGIVKPRDIHWKAEAEYIGDPPMEEQGLNAVFNGDSSTWDIIESFSKKLKIKN